ncbi:MAG: hypothetical protein HOM96_05595 [Rickettsiales bacterium]|nr:hypothetical protein [Rickettsiales bacterium]
MYLTEAQILNLEVKFTELSERYPSYRDNGLLEVIKGVIQTLDYRTLPNSEQGILSVAARGFLSNHFQVNLNQHPSIVGFLVDTLYAEILGKAELNAFRKQLSNPVTFEKLLLERVFFDKELFADVDKLDGLLSGFVDLQRLQRQIPEAKIDNDARILNQIIFFFGAPFDFYINSAARESDDGHLRGVAQAVQLCYDKMISGDFNIGDIVEDILFWPENLPNSLNSFFDKLAADAGFGLSAQDQRKISGFMNHLKDILIAYYPEHPSPFVLLKPRYAENLASESDLLLIWPAVAELKQAEAKASSGCDNQKALNMPAQRPQYFSKKELKFMAVTEKLSSHLSKEWQLLSIELLNIYSKQLAIPETREIFGKLPVIGFTIELFLRHYKIGNGERLYRTFNIQLDKILAIVGELHIINGGKDLLGIQTYASRLQQEIKGLKTKRQINDKVAAYFRSGLHDRIINAIEHHLKPFARVIAEHAPYTIIGGEGGRGGLLSEIDVVIRKTSEISNHFKQRYQEVSDEIVARQEHEELIELTRQAEYSAKLDKEAAERQKVFAEMAAKKEAAKQQSEIISYGEQSLGNGGLVELQWELKGDQTRADTTYKQDSYRVVITKKLYDLISDAKNSLSQDIKDAVESGFIPTVGRGKSGVKPMDNGEVVEGYVVLEVKLKGSKPITNFLGNSSVTIGDIRLCGVLKDGVFLISEISQHGKNNVDLGNNVQRIKGNIMNGSIEIKLADTERSATELSSVASYGR